MKVTYLLQTLVRVDMSTNLLQKLTFCRIRDALNCDQITTCRHIFSRTFIMTFTTFKFTDIVAELVSSASCIVSCARYSADSNSVISTYMFDLLQLKNINRIKLLNYKMINVHVIREEYLIQSRQKKIVMFSTLKWPKNNYFVGLIFYYYELNLKLMNKT